MKTSLAVQQAQAQLGIAALRKHQIKLIQSILDHHDTLVIALHLIRQVCYLPDCRLDHGREKRSVDFGGRTYPVSHQ